VAEIFEVTKDRKLLGNQSLGFGPSYLLALNSWKFPAPKIQSSTNINALQDISIVEETI
jgi:hypothetical protein